MMTTIKVMLKTTLILVLCTENEEWIQVRFDIKSNNIFHFVGKLCREKAIFIVNLREKLV